MPDFILHHYDASPFAHKAQWYFGFKQLAWRSVVIPMVMPKPLLMPLTGGYRRTPVMQIGADIYFDTSLIAAELERRQPAPSFYPAGGEGMAAMMTAYADQNLFLPAANFSLAQLADRMPAGFFEDRAAMMNRPVTPVEKIKAAVPLFKTQMYMQLDRVESLLADGRAFALGDKAGLADFALAHPLWMVGYNSGKRVAAGLDPYPTVRAWLARVEAIGTGTRTEMEAAEALAIAKAATPETPRASEEIEGAPKLGTRVSAISEDRTPEPVVGEVVMVRRNEVALGRRDPEAGEIVVHMPRAGFIFKPV
ncbi:MAG: glutathione S-transferase family protein [Rhodospirillaceae bacterium]|nr:glutathione S-transferase family protein [Rhodospirillaceae bacterium]